MNIVVKCNIYIYQQFIIDITIKLNKVFEIIVINHYKKK